MKYYTIRGFKNGKLEFQSDAMSKSKAIDLKEDIKNNLEWAKELRFTIKKL